MTNKKKRILHSPEFKAEALKLAEKVGVAATANQLSLHESQIYGWRKAATKDTSSSQREKDLAVEVAKLKRQLAEQAEELDIVKKAAVGSSDHCNKYTNILICRITNDEADIYAR